MSKFFFDGIMKIGLNIKLKDEDLNHIKYSLRKIPGDIINICDGKNNDYKCIFNSDYSTFKIISEEKCCSELKTRLNIFLSISKHDKLSYTIKQCVEIGVYSITIFKSKRCISKINDNKITRYKNIIYSAAKQSNRGIIPNLNYINDFYETLIYAKQTNSQLILAYEKNNNNLKTILNKTINSVAIFIGPEGGFEEEEIIIAKKFCDIISLGNRILRCETAAVYLSSIMTYYYD